MQKWPFKVIEVNENEIKVEITERNEVKQFSAVEICAMILGKLKSIAESYLKTTVKNAVITVPAYFNDLQRKAVIKAATMAELNVSRILNEPTAAAIAYGLSNDMKVAKNILVYDLGGGTFDVSILNVCDNVYEVKSTAGDTHLGGEDIDNCVLEKFAIDFKQKHKVDISCEKKTLRRLQTECERAKKVLSSMKYATIQIDSLRNGIDFVESISRARFNDMGAELFRSTIAVVEVALKDANLKSEDIDAVVLVGGSTRIPKVRQLLHEFFKGEEISETEYGDKAVVYGAAVQAAIIHGGASTKMKNIEIKDVMPLTLGTTYGKNSRYMMTVIERNTPIPVAREEDYVTFEDKQTKICVQILQGEHRLAKENIEIGSFTVDGIPTAPARVEEVTIKFSIDVNGVLTVTEHESKPKGPPIGIDLGTTASRVGVVCDGKVKILPNALETPTESADGIFDVKRFIGRKFARRNKTVDVESRRRK